MKAKVVSVLLLVFLVMTSIPAATGGNISENIDGPLPVPEGYVHRPVAEFFTGLSCSACMQGTDQDMDKLNHEVVDSEDVPFTFISFHELNGGGEDSLRTEEAEERMRFYQPGVSGTPNLQIDGGYINLGGMSGGSLNYDTAKQGIADATVRYDATIDPRHPIQSLRNGFKFVNLEVSQVFTGDGFAVSVNIDYLGTTAFIDNGVLNGQLYVFMIEDDVTAWSAYLEEWWLNQHVFRGYAIEAKEISLGNGENTIEVGEWKIPTDAEVPIKPGDVTAIAVMYDMDDTASEEGNEGNSAQVPRAINSATPRSTAFDRENSIPEFGDIEETIYGNQAEIKVQIDDPDGISIAYILYNYDAANSTSWESQELELDGEEICNIDGSCYAIANPVGTALINGSGGSLYYMLIAYDGNLTEAKSEVYLFEGKVGSIDAAGGVAIDGGAVIGGVAVLLLLGVAFFLWTKMKAKKSLDSDSTDAEGLATEEPTPSEDEKKPVAAEKAKEEKKPVETEKAEPEPAKAEPTKTAAKKADAQSS